jgi:site-specific DNA-adenine methylase
MTKTFCCIKNIIEPFCGACAISFNIRNIHKDKVDYFLNDNNKDIYNKYQLLKPEIALIFQKN